MLSRSAALTAILALVATAVVASPPSAPAAVPTGATPVPVAAGATTSGIDAVLGQAGAVSGTVTSATTHKGIAGVAVQLYDSAERPVGEGDYDGYPYQVMTGDNGGYTVPAMIRGTYYVCFSSETFVDRCLGNVQQPAGHGNVVPKGAKTFTLGSGQHRTGVNIALDPGASIRGVVRASATRTDHPAVTVSAVNRSNGFRYKTESNESGKYVFTGLAASTKGYSICFDASAAAPKSSKTGYLDQCYRDAPWAAGAPVPAKAAAIRTTPGHTRSGINALLHAAGAIAGTIRITGTRFVSTLQVVAFSKNRKIIARTDTGADGKGAYHLTGLPASGADHVCVETNDGIATGACYRNVPYASGALPKGTANVRVRITHTHTGVSFTLHAPKPRTRSKVGTISGTVTDANGGAPHAGAQVSLYTSTLKSTPSYAVTDSSGHYVLELVPPGSGYRVCAGPANTDVNGATSPGVSPACHGAAWNGGGAPPSSATHVTVTGGHTTTGVDLALPDAGAITGTVTVAAGHGLDTTVHAYDRNGHPVGRGQIYNTDTGAYRLVGLAADSVGYRICFGGAATDYTGADPFGDLPECYDNKLWDIPVPQAEFGTD